MPNKSGARGIHTAAAKEQFRNILQLTISTLRPKCQTNLAYQSTEKWCPYVFSNLVWFNLPPTISWL